MEWNGIKDTLAPTHGRDGRYKWGGFKKVVLVRIFFIILNMILTPIFSGI